MPSNTTEGHQSQLIYTYGRGGAGNIHCSSVPRNLCQPGPDGCSPQGCELANRRNEQVTSTGRGGAGNLRSPTRDAHAAAEAAIRIDGRYIRELYSEKGEKIYSTGRGGAGNISRSVIRPLDPCGRAPLNRLFSTNHGRFWSFIRWGCLSFQLDRLEEEDRKDEHEEVPQHSSGRGGFGNMH